MEPAHEVFESLLAKTVDELGRLREALGIDDEQVNTVDEEGARTAFWTLSDLITSLERSWKQIRHPRD